MRNIIAVSIAGLILSGCASAGTNYNQDALYGLQPGADIRSVVSALGRPNAEAVDEQGNTVLVWVHSTASVLGAEVRSVRLSFDANGRLISVPQRLAVLGADASGGVGAPGTAALVATPPTTTFSFGVVATSPAGVSSALSRVRALLAADGFTLVDDAGSSWVTTAPMPYELKPEHADCGRQLGIPFLADRRAKSTVAYRASEVAGSLRVQVALSSVYEPGYGAPARVLTCTSSGQLERELLARVAS